jgi:hypothetical protein
MERGDLAVVIIALSLVIVLTVVLSPTGHGPRQEPVDIRKTPAPTTIATPVPETTTVPATETPTPLLVTTTRIHYTTDYALFPVRFLPSDMSGYGSSDADWKYSRSVVFAYIEENHGGITETFTVPYPVWRMTATVTATRTPEKARFRMVLVDEQSGRILEGAEIRFPGTVTKTTAARGRPLYMIIAAENLDGFTINLEAPSDFFS